MKRSNLRIMLSLLGLIRPLLGNMLLAVLAGTAGFLCAIGIPVLGSAALVTAESMGALIACIVICALLRGPLKYAEQLSNHYIAFKLLALIRDKIFTALRRLAPAKLEGKDKGSLISMLTTDIELLEVFYAHTISPICIAALVSAAMTAFFALQNIYLAMLAFAAYLAIGVLLPILVTRLNKSAANEHRRRFGELNSLVLESLRGLKEIIQFGAGTHKLQQLNEATDELLKKQQRLKRRDALTMSLTGALILLFSLAMLLAALHLHRQGRISFEAALLSTVAMLSSFGPVVALSALSGNLPHTFAAANRVLDCLAEAPQTEDITGQEEITFSGAEVQNLSFAYQDEEVLSGLSLGVKQGELIGITGKSGSGKSTLLKLLMRFWDVRQGKITISGRAIDQVNTANLRSMESLVAQETQLFHDSIANNIRLSRPAATEEELIAACKKASIHDFIMTLPQGYATNAGELGEHLSGGERQRIGLARAFLHDAPFLLLDEPTSNLDSLNEAVILRSLREECRDKTVVLVSHRKSTMTIADRVYAVENGRVC